MKKIISLILCVMLVAGVMSIAVSAIDARFLEEYGQTVYFIESAVTTAPVANGIVSANEYTKKVETAVDEYGVVHHPTEGAGPWAITKADYYIAYDEECLYLAAEIYDNDHVPYGTFDSNYKRGDQFCFSLGGIRNVGNPEGIASRLAFRFFDGNRYYDGTDGKYTNVEGEDFFECQDSRVNYAGKPVSSDYYTTDRYDIMKEYKVNHNAQTGVTTYEVAIKWSFLEEVWPDLPEEERQYKYLTFGAVIQDSSNVKMEDKDEGHRIGMRNWGTTEGAEDVYDMIFDEYGNAAFFGEYDEFVIPNMIYLGTEEEFEAFKTAAIAEEEARKEEERKQAEEEARKEAEEEAQAAKDKETAGNNKDNSSNKDKAPAGDKAAAKTGCGGSVAAISVALVAILGTCTAFVSKKR